MQCKAYIYWVVRKAGRKIDCRSIVAPHFSMRPDFDPATHRPKNAVAEGFCTGSVTAQVRAAEDPYLGGVSAVLEVTYTCDHCGNECFVYLPGSESELSELVTKQLQSVDEVKLFDAWYAKEQERQRILEEQRKLWEQQRVGRKK